MLGEVQFVDRSHDHVDIRRRQRHRFAADSRRCTMMDLDWQVRVRRYNSNARHGGESAQGSSAKSRRLVLLRENVTHVAVLIQVEKDDAGGEFVVEERLHLCERIASLRCLTDRHHLLTLFRVEEKSQTLEDESGALSLGRIDVVGEIRLAEGTRCSQTPDKNNASISSSSHLRRTSRRSRGIRPTHSTSSRTPRVRPST